MCNCGRMKATLVASFRPRAINDNTNCRINKNSVQVNRIVF